MLDIKFIRENKDLIDAGAKKKHLIFDVSELISIDDKRKDLLILTENKKAEQNKFSDQIVKVTDESERAKLILDMKLVKEELMKGEEKLREVMKKWQYLMLHVPNIPDMTVPEGNSDADNKEISTWGEKPKFDFEPKDHMALMTDLKMVDFDRGVKVHGFRGYFLMGDGVRLSIAIWNYAMEFFSKKNFIPVLPPIVVRKEALLGTGYLPQGEDDLYKTQDGEYLAGTAEVPVMAYHSGEILDIKELPKRYLGFSPCYRREVGSHSKDVKGLIRVHEFYKLEQIIICEASHTESVKFHEEMNRNTEEFIESLGIPYHTVVNCGGDLGLGQVKKYDIELWVPKENKYREISSASYFHDFQTRRSNIKYRDALGKTHYTHSLNCTAIPTPRILVSLVENFQQVDGSIKIPFVLQKYMGKSVIS